MANVSRGLGGAASGAAAGSAFGPWGTAIGGVAGGLIGLFGGGDDGGDQYAANQKLWQDALDHYQGPESDPEYQRQLTALGQQANTGLTPADKAAMLEAYSGASQMARGREGAIQQQAQMRGGGVANSGQLMAAQQGAAQAGAQRYQAAGMQQAGIASQRALQARQGYLNTVENNKAALNRYRMAATGGMTGANTQMGDYYGARDASRNAGMEHVFDNVGNWASMRRPGGGGGAGVDEAWRNINDSGGLPGYGGGI